VVHICNPTSQDAEIRKITEARLGKELVRFHFKTQAVGGGVCL
jgi:hypothetical protein